MRVEFSGRDLSAYRAMTEVHLPNGLERVGAYWFSGSHIKLVDIPASVREIGCGAFRDCTYLTELIIRNGLKRIGACCF